MRKSVRQRAYPSRLCSGARFDWVHRQRIQNVSLGLISSTCHVTSDLPMACTTPFPAQLVLTFENSPSKVVAADQPLSHFHSREAVVSAEPAACLAATKLAPGSVWKVASTLRSGSRSWAQARRPRSVRCRLVAAKDLLVRMPNSLRVSVTLFELEREPTAGSATAQRAGDGLQPVSVQAEVSISKQAYQSGIATGTVTAIADELSRPRASASPGSPCPATGSSRTSLLAPRRGRRFASSTHLAPPGRCNQAVGVKHLILN